MFYYPSKDSAAALTARFAKGYKTGTITGTSFRAGRAGSRRRHNGLRTGNHAQWLKIALTVYATLSIESVAELTSKRSMDRIAISSAIQCLHKVTLDVLVIEDVQ